jgi:hypothetical protein
MCNSKKMSLLTRFLINANKKYNEISKCNLLMFWYNLKYIILTLFCALIHVTLFFPSLLPS